MVHRGDHGTGCRGKASADVIGFAALVLRYGVGLLLRGLIGYLYVSIWFTLVHGLVSTVLCLVSCCSCTLAGFVLWMHQSANKYSLSAWNDVNRSRNP